MRANVPPVLSCPIVRIGQSVPYVYVSVMSSDATLCAWSTLLVLGHVTLVR